MGKGRISSSYSNNDTRHVTLITHPVMSIADDTGTYPLSHWYFVMLPITKYQCHGGDGKTFKVMIST
jgi:hypothetical protein